MENATQQSTATADALRDLQTPPIAAPLARVGDVVPVVPPTATPVGATRTAAADLESSFSMSEQIDQLLAGIVAAQLAFDVVERNRLADVKSKKGDGASFTYGYADLAEVLSVVRPKLAENNIALIQFPEVMTKGVRMTTFLGHVSGQFIKHRLTLPAPVEHLDTQGIGGVITYARRYVLQPLLGVAPEIDTDAVETRRDQIARERSGRVVEMPQRQSAQPTSTATATATTAAPPRPGAAAFPFIAKLEKKMSQAKPNKAPAPYWVVELSDGRQGMTTQAEIGQRLEHFRSLRADIVDFEIENGKWIVQVQGRPHAEGHR